MIGIYSSDFVQDTFNNVIVKKSNKQKYTEDVNIVTFAKVNNCSQDESPVFPVNSIGYKYVELNLSVIKSLQNNLLAKTPL